MSYKTNWENLGGAKRREEMPAHNIVLQAPGIPRAGIHLVWEMCTTRRDPESDQIWVKQDDWPETTWKLTPFTIKPETASHVAEHLSFVPLFYCSLAGLPFPTKSSALSVCVSPGTIHFQVLDKSPLLGPGRVPPSCNSTTFHEWWSTSKGKFKGKQLLECVYSDFRRKMCRTGSWCNLVQSRPHLNPPLNEYSTPNQKDPHPFKGLRDQRTLRRTPHSQGCPHTSLTV